METVHYEYGVRYERFELAHPASSIGMNKNILDLIHVVPLVYGSSHILYECFITHPKSLKMHGIYRSVPLFIRNIHTLRYGNKRHECTLFRTQVNVIFVGEYVQFGGSIIYSFYLRHWCFHGQDLIVHSLTADNISRYRSRLLHGHGSRILHKVSAKLL